MPPRIGIFCCHAIIVRYCRIRVRAIALDTEAAFTPPRRRLELLPGRDAAYHRPLTPRIHAVACDSWSHRVSAEIIQLSHYRSSDEPDLSNIDIYTAVDVAIRDLREVLTFQDAQAMRRRVAECEDMLRRTLIDSLR
jgi:hypothetical protein